MYVFLNDSFLPAEKAMVHVSDLAIHRGYGIFDFLKIQDNCPLFIEDYFNRFYTSADILQLSIPLHREELRSVIYELIGKNNLPQSGIKMILTGGNSADGFHPGRPNLIITQQPMTIPGGTEKIADGIKVITHEYMREIPSVKTINYITGIWLLKKMKEQSAADVLYHVRGEVSEFPRCNFFIVRKDGVIQTPAKNILKGITRMNVLALAKKKYAVEETAVTFDDVINAEEAFLTSTTKRIVPVVKIDDNVIGTGKPGDITKSLWQELVSLENAELERCLKP